MQDVMGAQSQERRLVIWAVRFRLTILDTAEGERLKNAAIDTGRLPSSSARRITSLGKGVIFCACCRESSNFNKIEDAEQSPIMSAPAWKLTAAGGLTEKYLTGYSPACNSARGQSALCDSGTRTSGKGVTYARS